MVYYKLTSTYYGRPYVKKAHSLKGSQNVLIFVMEYKELYLVTLAKGKYLSISLYS